MRQLVALTVAPAAVVVRLFGEEGSMHPAESAHEREHLRKALQEAQKAHDASSPMSALPLKADIGTQSRDVRFVPKADIAAFTPTTTPPS